MSKPTSVVMAAMKASSSWIPMPATSGLAVSYQLQNDEERVIAYYSRTLRNHERNYCVKRKEVTPLVVRP